MTFIKFTRIHYFKIYYYSFKIIVIFLLGIFIFLLVHFSWLESKLIFSKILFFFSFEHLKFFTLTSLNFLKDITIIIPAVVFISLFEIWWHYLHIYILNFPAYVRDFVYFYCSHLIKEDKFLNLFNLNVLNLCWTVRGFKLMLQGCFGFFVVVCFFYVNYENWLAFLIFFILVMLLLSFLMRILIVIFTFFKILFGF